jgi:hypothetical protein
MRKKEIEKMIRNKLEANYNTYIRQLQTLPADSLIEQAAQIAATKLIFKELCKGGYKSEYMEYLLRFQNPLEVVRDHWLLERNVPLDGDNMEHVLWTLSDRQAAEQDYELDEAFLLPEQGVRMC